MGTYTDKYQDCLAYIDSYWDKIIFAPAKKKINRHIIDIPYSFVTPNDKKFRFIFYWDSYFISRGLLGTKREWLLKSMVENFLYLYEKYHFIPNFNAPAAMGRSQPPFLTSMIMDAYAVLSRGKSPTQQIKNSLSKIFLKKGYANSWLEKTIEVAIREYANVWIDLQNNYHHRVKDFDLSRYGDRDLGYAHSSELESGWDFTSRFYNRCDEFLPIDLNVYLYKYEKDFAKAFEILLNQDLVKDWNKKANLRKRLINKYMWNQKKGFFYDYNYRFQRQSDFLSLAGFTPMWAGLATTEQAKRMVKMLRHFETEHGLIITNSASLAPKMDLSKTPLRYRPAIEAILQPKQWDYPNIWPPLEYLTVIGLLRYGFIKEATRIMEKSLKSHARLFRKYGTFFEKIDGAKGDQSANYHYQAQTGFGWTNAVFYRYIQILDDLKADKSIFKTLGSKKPPYQLSIYH